MYESTCDDKGWWLTLTSSPAMTTSKRFRLLTLDRLLRLRPSRGTPRFWLLAYQFLQNHRRLRLPVVQMTIFAHRRLRLPVVLATILGGEMAVLPAVEGIPRSSTAPRLRLVVVLLPGFGTRPILRASALRSERCPLPEVTAHLLLVAAMARKLLILLAQAFSRDAQIHPRLRLRISDLTSTS